MTRVIHFFDSRTFGGCEQAALELMASLDRMCWQPVLLHHDAPGLAPLAERASALGIERRTVAGGAGWSGVLSLPALVHTLRREHALLFHAHLHWPLACTGAIVAARAAGIRAVVATVQLAPDLPDGPLVALERLAATAAVNRYIAVSRETARAVQRMLRVTAARVTVIHNGVDPYRFMAAAPEPGPDVKPRDGPPRVLVVARLAEQKGCTILLQAAAQVPDALFLVAGVGPLMDELRCSLDSSGLNGRVRLLGWREDIPELAATADLFVLPSLREGLPLALLEAMAAARPAVASAIGGIDEAVEDGVTGLLVPPGDAAALAAAIRQLLADPRRARRMGQAGRARVLAHFTAASTAAHVGALYRSLLAQRSAGASAGALMEGA